MQPIKRVSIPMTEEERDALRRDAQSNLREPREHTRWLLRQALGIADNQPKGNANRAAVDSEAERSAAAA